MTSPLKAQSGRSGKGDGAPLVYAVDTYNQSVDRVTHSLRDPNGTFGDALPAVAFSQNQRGEIVETTYAHQLTGGGGKPGEGYAAIRNAMGVRRLTPTECERLQGLPDGWTDHGPDSRRYSALGDAVTANVAEWIGLRLLSQGGPS